MSGIFDKLKAAFGEEKASEIQGAAYEGPEKYSSRTSGEKGEIRKMTAEHGAEITDKALANTKGDVKQSAGEAKILTGEYQQMQANAARDVEKDNNPLLAAAKDLGEGLAKLSWDRADTGNKVPTQVSSVEKVKEKFDLKSVPDVLPS